MTNKAVEEGIKKARWSLFHYGAIDAFQGVCHAVVDSCVMLVVLYGCENWILKWASNMVANVVMVDLQWVPVGLYWEK